MKAIGDFEPINPGEIITLGFDFTCALTDGDTLISGVWACNALSGTPDPSPSSRIIGTAETSTTVSLQKVGNFIAGCIYSLEATVTTADGETLVLWAYQLCIPVGTAP